ncbi:hypothetical protein [Larkinella rosea]|uniref:Uncharacterized protein n=1 Tax=Larkinella rosea TaxID=2025312 RepID=A0A3P1BG80_9BACT|nr:hypothetical protein [Larkinella rosea]RRB00099.1 hypothetical protein EHT25_26105 [Larkinella rosea]
MKPFFLSLALSLMGFCHSVHAQGMQKAPASADTLTQQQLEDFGNEAKNRIKAFVDYLGVIADKNRSFEERNDAIRQAMLMFQKTTMNGKPPMVEISNIRTGKYSYYPIRQYLEKIKTLSYDRVEITNFESVRLNNWEKQPDGSYRATGQYFQGFKAWKNGNTQPVYADKTTKKIAADLNVREDPFYKEKQWMVLFGDITVAMTEQDNN